MNLQLDQRVTEVRASAEEIQLMHHEWNQKHRKANMILFAGVTALVTLTSLKSQPKDIL